MFNFEVLMSLAKDNLLGILIVISAFYMFILVYKKSKEELVKKTILNLVAQAEKTYGSGTGELKYAMVVERMYYVLPLFVRVIFTKKQLDRFIQDGVNYLKDYLSDGRTLEGYEVECVKNNKCE